jgi:protease IV
MKQFFKFFFASFLGIVVFTIVVVLIFFIGIASLSSSAKPSLANKAVLYLDISKPIMEQKVDNPFSDFSGGEEYDQPGLYDIIRLLQFATTDNNVSGIYLKCNYNASGLATSNELREALLAFKKSKKFIYAYGDVIAERSFHIISVADKIYCNPQGGVEWKGFSLKYMFFKNTLAKLEIEPEIFYAGKFKSATEPLRSDKMTDANRLQSQVFIDDIYKQFLQQIATSRNVDTATLRQCANQLLIHTPADAVKYKLIDGVKYDDQVKEELTQQLGLATTAKINFVEIGKYAESVNYKKGIGNNTIALIYAQGNIVDGKGDDGEIGGDSYRALFRKARLDDNVKAIVVRVNSGGGSALASENMWRELALAKKEKPVVLSFGDYAASGGYYMSCMADSIFCQPNTLTGSIGVFSVLFNTQKLFNNKLGITFDGVKTGNYSDMMELDRPLTEVEKKYIQTEVDSIYATFLTRVSNGRKISIANVDSMAQGRIWTGISGLRLQLVDRLGGLQDAVDCAARMAKTKTYRLKEYPQQKKWFEKLFNSGSQKSMQAKVLQKELGKEGLQLLTSFKKLHQQNGSVQASLPFEMKW